LKKSANKLNASCTSVYVPLNIAVHVATWMLRGLHVVWEVAARRLRYMRSQNLVGKRLCCGLARDISIRVRGRYPLPPLLFVLSLHSIVTITRRGNFR